MKKNLGTILFFFANVLYAQPAKIIFDHYGLKEGFNSRKAMNITTTPNRLVLITSNDGLSRYDGNRFKFYQHIPGDSNYPQSYFENLSNHINAALKKVKKKALAKQKV
jgi:hypothetical protein